MTEVIDLASAGGQAWEFQPEGGEWQAIRVPEGGWRAQGLTCDAGTYRTRLTIPASAQGKAVRLTFQGINFGARVLAGPGEDRLTVLAEHVGGWMPVVADLTPLGAAGQELLLVVEVKGRKKYLRDGKYLVAQGGTWQEALADGILRGVTLEILPPVSLDAAWVRTDVAGDALTPEFTVHNTTGQTVTATVAGTLTSATGQDFAYPDLPPVTVTLEPGESRPVALPRTGWGLGPRSYWWPNVPYQPGYRTVLHTLTLSLSADGQEGHALTHRFGFRQFAQNGAHWELNGIRCNLRGDNLQEANFGTDAYGIVPGFGAPTADNPGWPQAVDNLQRVNHNVLRIHQVPGTPYMLDVADELGLMIIDETPVRGSEGLEDFVGGRANMIRAAHDLALRDRHHPSIVLWSAANEIWGWRGLALALQAAIRAVDDTRPIIIDGVEDMGPEIINTEHYCGGLGVLPERGGTPRADRPYGETESVWPADNSWRGFAWMSTATRIRRLKNNADIRNYVLNNCWSDHIPGQRPELQYLEKKIKDIRWDWVVEQGMEILPPLGDAWSHRLIQLMQQSFHPFGTYDVAFDEANKHSDAEGQWPTTWPELKAGTTATRQIAVFNDAFAGEELTVRWSVAPGGLSGAFTLRVPLGEYRTRAISFPVPSQPGEITLHLETEKGGQVVFTEDLVKFTVVE